MSKKSTKKSSAKSKTRKKLSKEDLKKVVGGGGVNYGCYGKTIIRQIRR